MTAAAVVVATTVAGAGTAAPRHGSTLLLGTAAVLGMLLPTKQNKNEK
jgi:hypothetical protein